MRIEDAPPAGWYPDPEGTSRLRWWEGTDWSDRYRARPVRATVTAGSPDHVDDHDGSHRWVPDAPTYGGNLDTRAVVEQVRTAAREEAERAAALFGQQARAASRDLQPLISQYTSRITRWFRIASVLVVLALVAWLVWQIFVQVSLFEWIGDRIDNLTNGDAERQPVPGVLLPFW